MREFFEKLVSEWWGIAVLIVVALALLLLVSALFYRQFFKRFYDIFLSGLALSVFSPFLIILIIIGAISMKGNPFFTQLRAGKDEKVFKLIKFRTMTNEKDENGQLLSDEKRLTKYGKFLRSTSLDELPELINIFIGHMSVVGPRPLLVKYLSLYNEKQKHRHDVRPGLSGYAQVCGRNAISWEEKFDLDIEYINKISLFMDIAIILKTLLIVFKREGISSGTAVSMEEFKGTKEE